MINAAPLNNRWEQNGVSVLSFYLVSQLFVNFIFQFRYDVRGLNKAGFSIAYSYKLLNPKHLTVKFILDDDVGNIETSNNVLQFNFFHCNTSLIPSEK